MLTRKTRNDAGGRAEFATPLAHEASRETLVTPKNLQLCVWSDPCRADCVCPVFYRSSRGRGLRGQGQSGGFLDFVDFRLAWPGTHRSHLEGMYEFGQVALE